ncbi:proton-coupled folate transporter [Aplysia californica]|uniref:Proton-coupled folate transporter n=1 Tax=Aplysia californica TaxID=6500 RepID=A0ABM1A2D2_APLCA|nr:proton-coupled folate transporter [Aplysia californica]
MDSENRLPNANQEKSDPQNGGHYESFHSAVMNSDEGGETIGSSSTIEVTIQNTKPTTPSDEQQIQNKKLKWKATVVGILVPVMYFAGVIPSDTIAPQYLVHRLSEERGLNVTSSRVVLCGNLTTDPVVMQADELESEASDLNLNYSYALSGPALIICLFFGGFSDTFGRRPLLIISTLGGLIRMILNMVIVKFNLPLWVFYIGSAVDGLSGSFYTMLLAIFSSIADVNPEKTSRVFWIAVLTAAMACDTSIFSIVTGFLIDSQGFFSPSILCAGATAVAFLGSLFLFPETFPVTEKRAPFSVFGNIKRISGFFLFTGTIRKKLTFALCMAIFFFSVMNVLGLNKIDPLYQLHEPFCWTSLEIGIYLGARLAGQFLLGLVLLRLLQLCIKVELIALLGAFLQAGSYVVEAFVIKNWQFALVPVIGILGTTVVPIVRGIASSLADSKDQGAIFSSIAVVEVLCLVVSNTSLLKVYSATVATMPGAVYLLLAAYSAAAALLLIVFLCVRVEPGEGTTYETLVEADQKPQKTIKS